MLRITRARGLWSLRALKKQRTSSTNLGRGSKHSREHANEQRVWLTPDGCFNRGSLIRHHKHHARTLGKYYEVTGVLGEGASGSVTRARRRETGELVAIKAIPKDTVQDVRALQREVDLLKVADHPNIVRLYETLEDPEYFYLAMEVCSGGELWQRILFAHDNALGFSEVELAASVQQMLRAVAWCHEKCIVHCDLKPQNFLLASSAADAQLKLVDFGVSGVVPRNSLRACFLTKRCGTEGYMAPEVVLGQPYGPLADMFSLGAVVHTAIVGMPPRWDERSQKYIFPGRVRWRTLSPAAQSLFASLVQADPEARPTAAEALQHDWFSEVSGKRPMLDSGCVARMRRFRQRSKLQAAAMVGTVAFAQLRSEEMQILQDTFLAMDRDGSGEVSVEELAAALEKSQDCDDQRKTCMMEDARLLVKGMDVSGDGTVTYSEWLAAAVSQAWYSSSSGARRAFEALDADGDGLLSAAELQQLLPGVFSPMELEEEFSQLDRNGDGHIDFNEFCELLRQE